MKQKGRSLYRICKGVYPNHGQTMNWGRFYSWEQANEFLKQKLGWRYAACSGLFTIIDSNEIPF
jgi:hypothetical protein